LLLAALGLLSWDWKGLTALAALAIVSGSLIAVVRWIDETIKYR